MHRYAAAGLLAISMLTVSVARADLPPDMMEAVRYQQKNKAVIIARLRQRASGLKQQGDSEAAKAVIAEADAVQKDKLLSLPPVGEAGNEMPGTLFVEKIVERVDGGYSVQTSIPRWENTGVSVATGKRAKGPSPFGQRPVYYPETVTVVTRRAVGAGETLNVRQTEGGGFAEISPNEMAAASKQLKHK